MRKWIAWLFPKTLLWQLTLLNIAVIAIAIAVSGWAVYNTACFLVEGMRELDGQRQKKFNTTLRQYFWIFSSIGIAGVSLLHFYFTKKLMNPLKQLIEGTERLQKGDYPELIAIHSDDEMGQLVKQFNGLIQQLQANEQHRQKLVSNFSHEMRTPLSNLNGYLEALQKGIIPGDPSLFEALHGESQRLILMMEQLEQLKEWDHVQHQKIMKKKMVDIAELIEKSVATFEWTLNKKEIPLEFQVHSCNVYIQPEGIQQVIGNLVDNAIRYYEGTGAIRIEGRREDQEYCLTVSGPGQEINDEETSKIFERFYRMDASRSRDSGGSGLGLAIVKEIIERHHGKIIVNSKEGYNTFICCLPY